MTHKPIQFNHLSLSFPHKVCFENFSTRIHYGSRIALIGRNGSGKSTLLKLIHGDLPRPDQEITIPDDAVFGYVPQLMASQDSLSGGEQLNKVLTDVLAQNPNILLLDEPTNHLDQRNRRSLLRRLARYPGTLIIVSHDVELLTACVETLWHMDQGRLRVFEGVYAKYQQELQHHRASLEQELALLTREKKEAHRTLMKEQERSKKSNALGKKNIQSRKWPTIVSRDKARQAMETSGRKKNAIRDKKEGLLERLAALPVFEVIQPKFSILPASQADKTILSISDGSVGYHSVGYHKDGDPILRSIHLSLRGNERLALLGDNGSGKSTLLKGILGDPAVVRTGEWTLPTSEDIGYLDQQYATLDPSKTVLLTIQAVVPEWTHAELRRHLNDFLFFKNEEVTAVVSTLSGGERVRLSLAQIAAKPPKFLILDEISNNLDLETRDHVIQVLKNYPGAFIIVSHDENFLDALQVTQRVHIKQFC
jgi:ATPase subunit of ABC transporter with duplicated ATPase domains